MAAEDPGGPPDAGYQGRTGRRGPPGAVVDEPLSGAAGVGRAGERPGLAGWASRGRLAWIAAYAAAGVVLFACYLRVSATQATAPDGASNALEAWSMLHGNPLLRGWTLTDVSFYTTELPEYIAVELVRGLGPWVVHVSAAFTYTLLTLLAGLVAKGRATGREGVARALIGSGLMLAPQLGDPVYILLGSPDHVGTGVPLLLTFLVLDRAPRRWWTPLVIGLMLTWAMIGDSLTLFAAVIPLAAACAVRAYRGVVVGGKPLAAQWFEVSLIAAGLAAAGISTLVLREIGRIGGFVLLPRARHLASAAVIPGHLRLAVEGVLALFGADVFGHPHGAEALIVWFHLLGVGLVAWAACRALRRFFSRDDLLVQVLVVGIAFNLAGYVASVLPVTIIDTREIAPVLPFGAVLAGRLLAGEAVRAKLAPVAAVVLACYAAALGFAVAQPAAPARNQALADWLVAHHLDTGLGVYTEDNITTLDSGGRLLLITASWEPAGAVPRAYQSAASWSDPRLHYADFVLNTSVDGPRSDIPSRDLLAAFGRPAQIYHYGHYVIMVWHKNLLDDLGGPPRHGSGNL
ncbi:MAG TPA: hypothetical protein VME19_21395 [Streptosporangiaceae bacterium]|nr:hypothetical protein [Streptosporangiaceae bacterium]